jgi:hypothetical protein
MKKTIITLSSVFLSFLFQNCGLSNSYYINYNARPKAVMVSNLGAPMFQIVAYCKNEAYNNVFAKFISELSYTGKQGNVITIYYKESTEGVSRPPLTQELTYDLSISDTIQFKDTKIKIFEASNNLIKYEVINTPVYRYQPDTKIDSLSGKCTEILMSR